jgi:uncharacterized protein (TIGR03437 family)
MRFSALTGLGLTMVAIGAIQAPAQTTDDFFDDSFMQELRLEIRPSDWDTLRRTYLENTYYPADFHWIFKGKDIVLPSIGIRSRGHGSRSPVKPNLRLDFNRYEPGQKFLGLTSAVLKANNQDPSMLRERSVFKLWARTGLPASRETFARLYINNVYYGVFLLTEELRSEYTQRYLGEGSGDLYEWKPIENYHFEWFPNCTKPDQVACSTDPKKWADVPFNPEENKTTYDLKPTIEMIRTINTVSDADFERTVSGLLDLKLWSFQNAIENFIADADGILGDTYGMNNFWIYRYDKTSFHQFLLWDKDSSYDWWQRPIFEHADENVLMRRTLALPHRRQEYLESLYKVAVLAGGPGGWLEWEHKREYDLAKPSIYEDTFKQYGDTGNKQNSSNEIFETEAEKNVTFIRERTNWVMTELVNAGYQTPASLFLSEGAVVNAATGSSGRIAPGAQIGLMGAFTDQTMTAADRLPTTLGGVSVFINGFAAPVMSVSPKQVDVQVPWELGMGDGTARVTVMVNGPTAKGTRAGSPVNGTFSNTVSVPVGLYSPAVFSVQRENGDPVESQPAREGDILKVFANGLGPVTAPPPTGSLAPANPPVNTKQTPVVTIAGIQAEVLFSGLRAGAAGVYQVDIRVPPGLSGGSAALVVNVGGEISPSYNIETREPE